MAVPAQHRGQKMKVKKLDRYLNLARELKGLLYMSVTGIIILVGALERIPKNLEKRLGEMAT